jgi:transcriptional regulator with XRE-family HTH domain
VPLEAILADLARGFTREEACQKNGVSEDSLQRWERRKEFPTLRGRARANRKHALLGKVEASKEPLAGPPSLRQRLEQERARRGGDGKMPF